MSTRPIPPVVALPSILSSYQDANPNAKRLLLLDYDGTLSQHTEDPDAAIPTPRLSRIIEVLASDPRNAVWIISGRLGNFLERHFGKTKGLGLSAEHGGFVRKPGSGHWEGKGMHDGDLKPVWEKIRVLLESYLPLLPGAFVEYKRSSYALAYRKAPLEDSLRLTQELQDKLRALLADTPGIVVKQGIFVIEVRPVGVHKGEIATLLIDDYTAAEGGVDFALCAGDEGTDEDMFAAVTQAVKDGKLQEQKAWNVWVKGVHDFKTCAQWSVVGPPAMIDLLGELAGVPAE